MVLNNSFPGHPTTLNCVNIGTPKSISFPFVIGTPKTISFPFVPNEKLMILGIPIFEHIIIKMHCTNFGTLKNNYFYIVTNGNFIAFMCPNI